MTALDACNLRGLAYNGVTDQSITRASCFTASCTTAYFCAHTDPVVPLATLIGSKASTTGLLRLRRRNERTTDTF